MQNFMFQIGWKIFLQMITIRSDHLLYLLVVWFCLQVVSTINANDTELCMTNNLGPKVDDDENLIKFNGLSFFELGFQKLRDKCMMS